MKMVIKQTNYCCEKIIAHLNPTVCTTNNNCNKTLNISYGGDSVMLWGCIVALGPGPG